MLTGERTGLWPASRAGRGRPWRHLPVHHSHTVPPAATWSSFAVMFLDILVRGLTGVAVGTLALTGCFSVPSDSRIRFPGVHARGSFLSLLHLWGGGQGAHLPGLHVHCHGGSSAERIW